MEVREKLERILHRMQVSPAEPNLKCSRQHKNFASKISVDVDAEQVVRLTSWRDH